MDKVEAEAEYWWVHQATYDAYVKEAKTDVWMGRKLKVYPEPIQVKKAIDRERMWVRSL